MAAVATVQMWGNTRAVRIPKSLAEESGLNVGDKVTLTPTRQGLVVKAVSARRVYKLSSLLAQCKRRNPHREAIRGRAGRETF